MIVAFTVITAGLVSAQTPITLTSPDTSQTTTLTATVSEQAQVTVPAGVGFSVTNVSVNTNASSAAAVTVDSIVLATNTAQLKISLKANAASFTPAGGGTTWGASDVSWNAATFSNSGVGATGALTSNLAFHEIATCAADSTSCSTTDLMFTLGAKPTVQRSGLHTLVVTWKFEAI